MKSKSHYLAQGAILAALYTVLTHMQNLLIPGSATWAIQLRLSEALCVLAFFTPAAPLGLSIGCLLFNLTYGAALPLDFFLGSAATYLGCKGMYRCRKKPFPGLLFPAIANGLLVGWELTAYTGGGFWLNALYIALGEAIVLLLPGAALYRLLKTRKIGFY